MSIHIHAAFSWVDAFIHTYTYEVLLRACRNGVHFLNIHTYKTAVKTYYDLLKDLKLKYFLYIYLLVCFTRESRHLSPNGSPVPYSPTGGMPNSGSSPTPPVTTASAVAAAMAFSHSQQQKISGIPCVAAASKYTAPVHIDVGGTIYTSSLETLTK